MSHHPPRPGRSRNPGLAPLPTRPSAGVRTTGGALPPLPTIASVPRVAPPSPSVRIPATKSETTASSSNGTSNSVIAKSPPTTSGPIIMVSDRSEGGSSLLHDVRRPPSPKANPMSPVLEVKAPTTARNHGVIQSAPNIIIPVTPMIRHQVDLTATPPRVPDTARSLRGEVASEHVVSKGSPEKPTIQRVASPTRAMPPPQPTLPLPTTIPAALPSPNRRFESEMKEMPPRLPTSPPPQLPANKVASPTKPVEQKEEIRLPSPVKETKPPGENSAISSSGLPEDSKGMSGLPSREEQGQRITSSLKDSREDGETGVSVRPSQTNATHSPAKGQSQDSREIGTSTSPVLTKSTPPRIASLPEASPRISALTKLSTPPHQPVSQTPISSLTELPPVGKPSTPAPVQLVAKPSTPAPVQTTSKPPSTPAPVQTTSKPPSTPAPVQTTSKPPSTPAPVQTTSKPPSTPVPVQTTSKPPSTPAPVQTTSKPPSTPAPVQLVAKPSTPVPVQPMAKTLPSIQATNKPPSTLAPSAQASPSTPVPVRLQVAQTASSRPPSIQLPVTPAPLKPLPVSTKPLSTLSRVSSIQTPTQVRAPTQVPTPKPVLPRQVSTPIMPKPAMAQEPKKIEQAQPRPSPISPAMPKQTKDDTKLRSSIPSVKSPAVALPLPRPDPTPRKSPQPKESSSGEDLVSARSLQKERDPSVSFSPERVSGQGPTPLQTTLAGRHEDTSQRLQKGLPVREVLSGEDLVSARSLQKERGPPLTSFSPVRPLGQGPTPTHANLVRQSAYPLRHVGVTSPANSVRGMPFMPTSLVPMFSPPLPRPLPPQMLSAASVKESPKARPSKQVELTMPRAASPVKREALPLPVMGQTTLPEAPPPSGTRVRPQVPSPRIPDDTHSDTKGQSGEQNRSPGRITARIDVAPTSAGRRPVGLAMPPLAPSVPTVNVQPIGAMYPTSPQSRSVDGARSDAGTPSTTEVPQFAPGINLTTVGNTTMPARPSRPNYAAMTPAQQAEMRTQFHTKFGILRESFPQWQIVNPPESQTLDQIHDVYEGYVRQIIVSLNCNQWKVYLVIMFLVIEVFCIKVMGLDARGFTMSQVKIMNRYDQVLVELGEKYYVQGPSNWPVEARIIMMAAFNGIIFIAVKYLSKWLGGDQMAGTIQTVVDQFLSGSNLFGQSVQRDQFGIAIPPGAAPASAQPGAPASAPAQSQAQDPMANIGGILQGLMGGGGAGGQVDLTSLIANVGNALTGTMQTRGAAPTTSAQPAPTTCAAEARAASEAPRPPRKVPRFTD